jgi:hypothetical protein
MPEMTRALRIERELICFGTGEVEGLGKADAEISQFYFRSRMKSKLKPQGSDMKKLFRQRLESSVSFPMSASVRSWLLMRSARSHGYGTL